jgi:hypothetical protein
MSNAYNTKQNITKQLQKGTLFYFSSTAHYSLNQNTKQHAFISSDLTPTDTSQLRSLSNISNAFNNIHKCSIVWNNEEHYALIFTEKTYQDRAWIKIRTGFINARPHFSNTLPIISLIN